MFRSGGSWIITGFAIGFLITTVFMLYTSADSDDSSEETSLSHGLGEHISWHTLKDGLALAKKESKPLMLIIHKSWCGACKSLKPKFRESREIGELSGNFIMVNTMDDDEPVGDIYRPDGGYIPRILFFDPEGELLDEVVNEDGNPQYKYYYYDDTAIVTAMNRVTDMYPSSQNKNENIDDNFNIKKHNVNITTANAKTEL